MDDDLKAAAAIGPFASSDAAAEARGKSRAPRKAAAPPKKKRKELLMPEERDVEVIKDEEKFKAQYAALKSRGGKQTVEEVGDGENARPRGKTNSKEEDKRDAASNALIASVEGMMSKKDSRKEERRCYKQEQMNAFMEIQRRRLEMDAEKQVKMLEMEAEKQAKMLEIKVADTKTKAKEVALASMMTGEEIMKVDLNTVSLRKRPWFEKMQADMLKFDEE
ncbi:C2 domain-containing protein [Hordeum vulgare]|nr:C2 domain-containing protein [Hordeum vulgare]